MELMAIQQYCIQSKYSQQSQIVNWRINFEYKNLDENSTITQCLRRIGRITIQTVAIQTNLHQQSCKSYVQRLKMELWNNSLNNMADLNFHNRCIKIQLWFINVQQDKKVLKGKGSLIVNYFLFMRLEIIQYAI